MWYLEKQLSDFITQPVKFSATHTIKSHFGKASIINIDIELMGGIQKYIHGPWESPVDITNLIIFVPYQNWQVPVLDLKYEYKAYQNLDRTKRAETILKFLQENNNS